MRGHEDLGPFARLGLWVMGLAARALFRIRIAGIEHLPPTGPAVVAGNHVSALDGVLLGLVVWHRGHRVTRFLTADEFFSKRLYGAVLRAYRQIPLRRGERDADALAEAVTTVRDGAVAGIYPEGRVNPEPYGPLQRGHSGVARIALAADAPVVPVATWGTQDRWPKPGLRFTRPFRPVVAFVFGPPIVLEGDPGNPDAARAAAETVMAAIGELVPRARGLADA
jgi:1-acyl-sn-glycerol-3-phosphate acyltransferase